MAIRFYNIRSDETVVAETEPQIAALLSNSDRSPNITQGQDFGWRLSPEVVAEMKEILANRTMLTQIAVEFGILPETITESDVLTYISNRTDLASAPVASQSDYTDSYNEKVKNAERERREAAEKSSEAPVTTTQTTESLADLEKRVELAERLAAAQNPVTTTTTTVPTTTTTTTKK